MPELLKIDLHMHSTVSDGTDSPEEILSRVESAGINVFSLTDHDATLGSAEILSLLAGRGTDAPRFIPGVEFSCKDDLGRYHILGYGYDTEGETILSIVEKGHSLRMHKVIARIDLLKSEFGIEFPREDLNTLFGMHNPGKPHIANLMVKHGYAETFDQAMKDYLNKIRISSEYVAPEEAIAGILGSGGIPVLAHPFFGNGDQLILGEEMEQRLERLMGFGLKGVEAFYSGFTKRLTGQMLGMAERYGLYVTAGSDYHGQNKLIELGDNGLERTDELPGGLLSFLEALGQI